MMVGPLGSLPCCFQPRSFAERGCQLCPWDSPSLMAVTMWVGLMALCLPLFLIWLLQAVASGSKQKEMGFGLQDPCRGWGPAHQGEDSWKGEASPNAARGESVF